MNAPQRRGSLVGPVLLITAGVILLLNNMGLLQWGVWEAALRLWPILLIAAGLDILVGRRSAWGSLLVLVVMVGLIGGSLWFATLQVAPSGQPLGGEKISQSLEGARLAEVEISPAVSQLRIGPSAGAGKLVEGTVSLEAGATVNTSFRVAADTAYYTLKTQGYRSAWGNWDGRLIWDLRLAADVPLRLKVNNAVGESALDLSRLSLSGLTVDMGVGKTTVTLSPSGRYQAALNVGVGELVVRVPKDMAYRVQVRSGLGSSLVFGERRLGNVNLTSPGYDTAESRVDLTVNCGVGSVVVQQN